MTEVREQIYILPALYAAAQAAVAWLARKGITKVIKKFLLEGAKYKAEELCGQYYDKDICSVVFAII